MDHSEIYLEWLDFFLKSIPPARPVLLLEDGHSSHITIDVIEKARANDVHLLCLPAHTSHILQPLDIGVFKSFKTHYNKACRRYMASNPGCVITADVIAGLIAEAWPQSMTPMNILSGFKKCGVYPLNPGEVSDRMLAPSKSVNKPAQIDSSPRSEELVKVYEKRFEEGYDLFDPDYIGWLKEKHPEAAAKSSTTSVSGGESLKTHVSTCSLDSATSSQVLSDILVFPEPAPRNSQRKRKPGINARAICLSDINTLQELTEKENEKKEAENEKIRKMEALQEKRMQRQLENEKKAAAREEKRKARIQKKTSKKCQRTKSLQAQLEDLQLSDDDDVECPKCQSVVDCKWICCDNCEVWYHLHYTTVSPDNIPDIFFCEKCT